MSETGTLLQNRYSIVHIERISSFSKIFFALDTYQNPPRSCLIQVFEPIIQKVKIAKWIEVEFQREAKHLKQLSLRNRHIPEIYSYSSELQAYYIVRELIEGEPLSKRVEIKGVLSCSEVRETVVELLSVLNYLHQEGVIHQNIKPKNIILRNEDRMPMLINFGSIKQIVNTYGLYGDKQIFSTNNVYGYAPAEQAIGKSVPASDMYSLGLTALYLLTAKHPVDLTVDLDSGNIQVPKRIYGRDPHLAAVIARAINSNIGDRYSNAMEMLEDLQKKDEYSRNIPATKLSEAIAREKATVSQTNQQDNVPHRNWWKWAIYLLGSVYILAAALFALYDWNLNQSLVRSLPESSSLPASEPESPPTPETVPPLTLNSTADDVIEIPIFATGTTKQELKKVLGEPSAIQKGYWQNSSAWIYKKHANDSIDLGYLFDLNTDRLRQTEVAIAPSVGLETIEDILSNLLEDNTDSEINRELARIYNRQIDEYAFKVGNLEGSIEREADDHIYLGVWEEDFH